jgi:hypothetical protein
MAVQSGAGAGAYEGERAGTGATEGAATGAAATALTGVAGSVMAEGATESGRGGMPGRGGEMRLGVLMVSMGKYARDTGDLPPPARHPGWRFPPTMAAEV